MILRIRTDGIEQNVIIFSAGDVPIHVVGKSEQQHEILQNLRLFSCSPGNGHQRTRPGAPLSSILHPKASLVRQQPPYAIIGLNVQSEALLGGIAPPDDAPTGNEFSSGGVTHGITVIAVGDVGIITKEGETIAVLHAHIVLFGSSPQEEIAGVGAVGLCMMTKLQGVGRHGRRGIVHGTAHTGQ